MDEIGFNDLIFSAEMLSARRNDGTEIRFTRKERALLKEFVAKTNTVLTRDKLLEALHRDDQGDISERNIDFLVNRLRTKLGDKARDPRFIASQYGEGYIWIAKSIDETRTNAFLQIGPVYGLTETDNGERAFLDLLTTTLNSVSDKKAAIVCTRALQPHADQAPLTDYGLEASFYKDNTRLHAAFVLRHGPGRQAISSFRTAFANGDDNNVVRDLAINVQRALWAHMAMPASPVVIAPSDIPLEIRIHDAARTLAPSSDSWRESEARIEAARVAAPDGRPSVSCGALHFMPVFFSTRERARSPVQVNGVRSRRRLKRSLWHRCQTFRTIRCSCLVRPNCFSSSIAAISISPSDLRKIHLPAVAPLQLPFPHWHNCECIADAPKKR